MARVKSIIKLDQRELKSTVDQVGALINTMITKTRIEHKLVNRLSPSKTKTGPTVADNDPKPDGLAITNSPEAGA